VRNGNDISEQLEQRFGVPQGSISGPVLFTLYVKELLSIPNHCPSIGYVDDTKLLLALPPNQTTHAVSMLNDDLREITKCCCRNSLLINPDNSKLLEIGVPQLTRTLPPLSVTLIGKIIQPVTTAKGLGVYIDNSLNYNDHINKISSSSIYKLIMFNLIKYLLDEKTILLLIYSFVFNSLLYGFLVWSNTSKKNIKDLRLASTKMLLPIYRRNSRSARGYTAETLGTVTNRHMATIFQFSRSQSIERASEIH